MGFKARVLHPTHLTKNLRGYVSRKIRTAKFRLFNVDTINDLAHIQLYRYVIIRGNYLHGRACIYADESCLLEVHIYSTSDDQKNNRRTTWAGISQEFPWLKEIALFSGQEGATIIAPRRQLRIMKPVKEVVLDFLKLRTRKASW